MQNIKSITWDIEISPAFSDARLFLEKNRERKKKIKKIFVL